MNDALVAMDWSLPALGAYPAKLRSMIAERRDFLP